MIAEAGPDHTVRIVAINPVDNYGPDLTGEAGRGMLAEAGDSVSEDQVGENIMYVIYWCILSRGVIVVTKDYYGDNCFFNPSVCAWIIPGTVDPMEG